MLLEKILENGIAEVKLLSFRVEDEGCPHILFSVHTPINILQAPLLTSIESLIIQAQVFITGADQFAIDGSFIDVQEEFNFTYFQQLIKNGATTVDDYLDAFKSKLKMQVLGAAEHNNLNDSDESDVYWQCVEGNTDINKIDIMNNATRAVVLLDEATKQLKDYLISTLLKTQAN